MERRLDLALAALLLVVVAPFVPTLTAQGGPRYALPTAIVEHQTFELDRYEPVVGFDRVEVDGHLYSDKAPGQPVAGSLVALVVDLLGGESASEGRTRGNLGAWAQSLVFCTVPAALLIVLMRRVSAQSAKPNLAALAAIGLSFGTILLPLSSALYGHVLTATLLLGAWRVLTTRDTTRWILVAGALAAIGVLVEYPSAVMAVILGLWVLRNHRLRGAIAFALPHLVALGLIVVHNRLVYGTFLTGYSSSTKGDSGRLNFFSLPDPSNAVQIFFGSRGFIFTPIVIVGVVATIWGLRRRQWDLVVPAAMFGALFLLQAGWSNPWGGDGPGPRYIAPALPFLAVPVARGLSVLPPLARSAAVGLGVFSMGLVLTTYELVPTGHLLIETHLRYLFGDEGPNPTIFTMAIGPGGWALHAVFVVLAIRWVRSTWPRATEPDATQVTEAAPARP